MKAKKKERKGKAKNNQAVLFPKVIKCVTCGKETDTPVGDVYCSRECELYLPF